MQVCWRIYVSYFGNWSGISTITWKYGGKTWLVFKHQLSPKNARILFVADETARYDTFLQLFAVQHWIQLIIKNINVLICLICNKLIRINNYVRISTRIFPTNFSLLDTLMIIIMMKLYVKNQSNLTFISYAVFMLILLNSYLSIAIG